MVKCWNIGVIFNDHTLPNIPDLIFRSVQCFLAGIVQGKVFAILPLLPINECFPESRNGWIYIRNEFLLLMVDREINSNHLQER
jgi:hypothetical protein